MDFTYNDGGKVLPKDAFRISPSGLARFFSHTNNWWRENLLGEDGFKGNTSSYLGTIVHECANAYAQGEEIDQDVVESFISSLEGLEDVETSEITANWKPMVEAVVNGFLSTHPVESAEEFIYHELLPGIFPSGSYDYYENGTVSDFKTNGNLTAPKDIPSYYRYQLLTYAWLLRKQGKPVDRIRIVWITRNNVGRVGKPNAKHPLGAPLKDYPATCTTVTEMITDQDMEFIEGILTLVGESVLKYRENPELLYLLAQDIRLRK